MQKKRPSFFAAACSTTILAATSLAHAAAFRAGDLAVFVATNDTANTTGSIVELNTTDKDQSPVQTIPIDGSTSATALRFGGSADDTGYLSHTADGTLLTFTGAHTTSTITSTSSLSTRGVGTLDASANFSLATTYSGKSGYQTCSATSLDDSTWYIGDQAGIYSNGTSNPSPWVTARSVKSFGGVVYGLQSSSSSRSAVFTISAPTGGTTTDLSQVYGSSYAKDFYMASSGVNGATYDLLYVLNATSTTAGSIAKYSLVNGSWVNNKSFSAGSLGIGGFGLAVAADAGQEELYITTGEGTTTHGKVVRLTDTAGYNADISIDTTSEATLYTTSMTSVIKGIDFVPAAVPEPASLGILSAGALALLARRRK